VKVSVPITTVHRFSGNRKATKQNGFTLRRVAEYAFCLDSAKHFNTRLNLLCDKYSMKHIVYRHLDHRKGI